MIIFLLKKLLFILFDFISVNYSIAVSCIYLFIKQPMVFQRGALQILRDLGGALLPFLPARALIPAE
jgi:hypothetical protein